MAKYAKKASGIKKPASSGSSSKTKQRTKTGRSMSVTATRKKRKTMSGAVTQSGTTVKHMKVKDNLKNKLTFKKQVPKKLRNQIKQVLTEQKVRGYYRMYMTGGYHRFGPGPQYSWPEYLNNFEQWVFALPLGRETNGTFNQIRNGDAITRLQLLHAVSRCFNGKAQVDSFQLVNYGDDRNMSDPSNAPGATGNDGPSGLKIDVLESKCFIEMKNNTLQVYNLEMYVCKAKYKRRNAFNYINQAQCSATADWGDEIVQLTNSRVETQIPSGNTASVHGQIVSNLSPKSLGLSPEGFATWKSLWHFEKFVIRLEPGQIHKHTVVGDSCTIDFSKDYKDFAFQYLTPFERQVFFVAKPDLSIGRTISAEPTPWNGRNYVAPTFLPTDSRFLSFECQTMFKFAMPEPTGFTQDFTTNTNFTKTLNNRIYRVGVDYISGIAGGGTPTSIKFQTDDNAPGVVEQDD